MATRNIENWKERLITILVVPFTTCSARLPVYMILISLVIPNERLLGINYQGLTLMGLYIIGFLMAIVFGFHSQPYTQISQQVLFRSGDAQLQISNAQKRGDYRLGKKLDLF